MRSAMASHPLPPRARGCPVLWTTLMTKGHLYPRVRGAAMASQAARSRSRPLPRVRGADHYLIILGYRRVPLPPRARG